jgi:hypothetical protein
LSGPRPRVRPRGLLGTGARWSALGALGVMGAIGAIGMFGLTAGCNLHQEGVRPPDNRIFFPGGAIVEAGGKWLYVVNSNSDLRYNAGTVAAVDLAVVRADDDRAAPAGSAWQACPNDTRFVPSPNVGSYQCCWDILDPNILNCDEQKYIRRERSVQIGSFGGRPVIQQLPSGRRRMFVPVRGDTSITMLEVRPGSDDVTLLCTGQRTAPNESQPRFSACEDDWRITQDDPGTNPVAVETAQNQSTRLPDEPYALAVDEAARVLFVGHLRGGSISLIDLGDDTSLNTPDLVQIYSGVLPGDANGSQGVTSLTVRTPGCAGAIYATSRFVPVVGSFVVYGLDGSCGASFDRVGNRSIAIVGTGQILPTGLVGAETRGVEFVRPETTAAADRIFILQRTPPALVALDANTLTPFAVVEVCQGPTNLVQQTDTAGRAVALFVTCFDAGQVYVVDPWVPRVRSIIPVGRGPITTVLPPIDIDASAASANRAYIVGFGANNVAVLDLDPTSRTRDRVIQRIGFSSPTPRQVASQ